MSLDFFNEECQYPSTSTDIFGLCDNNDGSRAFPNFDNEEIWIAEVKNIGKFEIVITAIDSCLLRHDEYPDRGRCDCMLTTETHLYFIELKNKRRKWIPGAMEQLESTMELFKGSHDIFQYKKRKVFACNRKKRFVEITNAENKEFLRRTDFLKQIQTTIEVS